MSNDEPLKITLDDLEDEGDAPESAATPERSSRVRAQAEEAGRQVTASVKETADKLTQKIAGSAAEVTSRSAEAAREKMSEVTARSAEAAREKMGEMIQAQSKATADAIEARLREVDWKQEAQKGAEGGLRWLSKRLDELAGRVNEPDKPNDPANKDEPADPPAEQK